MIEQGILDKYIDESSFNMNNASRQKTRLVITKFFEYKSDVAYADLTKQDFIDMLSQAACMSINSFLSYKSTINDFIKWMYEQGYGSEQLSKDFAQIQYADVNRSAFYNRYYFSDLQDLFSTLETIFEDRGSEFDTFKAAALLIWYGIEPKEVLEILKSNLNEDEDTIENPATGQIIKLNKDVSYFLAKYKNDDTYDSRKMGGRVLSYVKSKYLLRSYRNAHLTLSQLSNAQSSTLKIADEHGKQFQWKRIYLSGLYYRMYEFEQANGEISRSDFEVLKAFFKMQDDLTPQRKTDLLRKLSEYQEFKSYMYS